MGVLQLHTEGRIAANFAELLGITVPKTRGFTLEDYADRKKFTIIHLERWGLHTAVGKFGDDVVAMPYADATATLLRTKLRYAKGTYWHDDGTGAHLYGQAILAKADPKSPAILVEGESDCHAAWHHGVVAVGVPGAGIWRPEWAPLVAGRTVYLWQEPDKGGAEFVTRVVKDIPDARVISLDGVKDLADLHANVGKEFKVTVDRCIASARPVGAKPGPSFSPIIRRHARRVESHQAQAGGRGPDHALNMERLLPRVRWGRGPRAWLGRHHRREHRSRQVVDRWKSCVGRDRAG